MCTALPPPMSCRPLDCRTSLEHALRALKSVPLFSNANDGAFVFKASHLLSPSLSSLSPQVCAFAHRSEEIALPRTRRNSPFPHKILVWKRQAPSSSEEGTPDARTNEPLIRRMPQPCQTTTPRWGRPRTSSSPCVKACKTRRSGRRCNLSWHPTPMRSSSNQMKPSMTSDVESEARQHCCRV